MLLRFREQATRFILPAFLFILLPVVRLTSTLDPGLAPRFFLTAIFCSCGTLLLLLSKKDLAGLFRKYRILLLLITAQLSWMLLTSWWSINPGDALAEWLRIAVLYIFFFLALVHISSGTAVAKYFSRFSFLAVFIFSAYGVWQLMALWKADEGHRFIVNLTIGSSLGNKNFFAEAIFMLLPFQLFGLWTDRRTWKYLFLFSALICLAWLVLLQTVSTWLAMLVAAVVVIVYLLFIPELRRLIPWKRQGRRWLALMVVSFFLVTIAVIYFSVRAGNFHTLQSKAGVVKQYLDDPSLFNSTTQRNENSVYERLLMWRNSIYLIRDHPLFGAGLNNWKILHAKYGIGGTVFLNEGTLHFEHPHNDYLLIWSEQGLPGILLYIGFFIFLLRMGGKSLRSGTSSKDKKLLLLMIFGISGFMVLSFFGFPRSGFYAMPLLLLQSALLLNEDREMRAENGKRRNFFVRLPITLLFIISLAGVYAAWARISGEIHIRKAEVDQISGNYARMLRETNKAESFFFPIDPASTPVAWYRGASHFYSRNTHEALSAFEAAEKVNPYHVYVLNDLATCYEQSGRYAEAITCYKRALEITPGFVEGLLNLSAAYFNRHEVDAAYQVISRITEQRLGSRDRKNLRQYRSSIFYAYAAEDSLQYPDTSAVKNYLQFIDNDSLLLATWQESVEKNISFRQVMRENFLSHQEVWMKNARK